MGLLPDTQNCGLRSHRECWKRFSRQRLQRKWLASEPGMHHGSCVTHVPWCKSGSLTRGRGENVSGISDACATHNFAYLVRGPYIKTLTKCSLIKLSQTFVPGAQLTRSNFGTRGPHSRWKPLVGSGGIKTHRKESYASHDIFYHQCTKVTILTITN